MFYSPAYRQPVYHQPAPAYANYGRPVYNNFYDDDEDDYEDDGRIFSFGRPTHNDRPTSWLHRQQELDREMERRRRAQQVRQQQLQREEEELERQRYLRRLQQQREQHPYNIRVNGRGDAMDEDERPAPTRVASTTPTWSCTSSRNHASAPTNIKATSGHPAPARTIPVTSKSPRPATTTTTAVPATPPKTPEPHRQPSPPRPAVNASPKRVRAATKLQRWFRRLRPLLPALRTLRSLTSRLAPLSSSTARSEHLQHLSSTLVLDPSTRDRLKMGASGNMGLLGYEEALVKMLLELDGVQSLGDEGVRERRREVVKEVEGRLKEVEEIRERWIREKRMELEGGESQGSGEKDEEMADGAQEGQAQEEEGDGEGMESDEGVYEEAREEMEGDEQRKMEGVDESKHIITVN
ncbi:hypothetical protein HK101_009718 [Irineochytrium annulatum]|nr:hypothetical protein HK101_009718 [Irineochytrium annulatum]